MQEPVACSEKVVARVGPLAHGERRRGRRVKVSHPVRLRPSDPSVKHFEEVRLTFNASCDGLYFTTRHKSYYKGMRLFVTFPYSSVEALNCEYLGYVVRIDQLTDGRLGVAVQLLSTINLAALGTRASRQQK